MPIFSAVAASLAALGATAGGAGATAGLGAAGAAGGLGAAAAGAAGATGAAAGAAGAASGVAAGVGSAAGAGGLAASLGGIAGLAGVGLQAVGTVQQMSAQKDAQKMQEVAEQTRLAQMNFESARQVRQTIRQGLAARSVALTNATGQGAAQGSGLQGGYGQISGQTGTNITGIEGQRGFGQAMFGINRQISSAQSAAATGAGISSLGGALFQNQNEIGKLGAYGFSTLFN
jgi:hypothetical protein